MSRTSRRTTRRTATPVAPVIADATPVAADLTPADLLPVADLTATPVADSAASRRAAFRARRNLGSMSLMTPAEIAAFIGYGSANVSPGALASFYRDAAVLADDDAAVLASATPRALVTVALATLTNATGDAADALTARARSYYAGRATNPHATTNASDLEIRDCAVRFAGRLMYRASRDAFRLAFASLPGRFGSRVHASPDPRTADIIRVSVLRDACTAFLAAP